MGIYNTPAIPFGRLNAKESYSLCQVHHLCPLGFVTRIIFRAAGGIGNYPCASSLMEEVDAVREALEASVEKGIFDVKVESDSKNLMRMINGTLQPEVMIKGILFDIRQLQQQLRSLEFRFAPCVCNMAAHLVTSFVFKRGGFIVGMSLNQNGCSAL